MRLLPKALIVSEDLDHPVRLAARRCGVTEIELVPHLSGPPGMFTLEMTQPQASLARTASSRPEWAYLLATSGTTGRPKLVPRSHRQLALYARSLGECYGLSAKDVGCHLQPLHHTHGLDTALLTPLLRGASVVCLPEFDIDELFLALDEYRISWLTAVPTVYRAILRCAPNFGETVVRHGLRAMRVGSARLEQDEIDRIEQLFGVPLLVGFGMTEARMITHQPLPLRLRKRGAVGVRSCNEVAIRSAAGLLCANGEVGEVVVRGPLVFEGYFDDAAATAAAFVDGWFRTGDLGWLDEDGVLYLVDRIKDLINRGGENISPLDIDAAIVAMLGVREAATFAIPHQTLGEEVVAAVVRDGGVAIAASDIIQQVGQRRGPQRAPRQIYFVEELPRTDSAKVRRADLPRLLGLDQAEFMPTHSSRAEEPSAMASPLEAALAGLWAAALQVKTVRRDDNFLTLGGDSLGFTSLLTSVNTLFGVSLKIELLSGDDATVAGMAQAIAADQSRAAADEQGTKGPHGARLPTAIPRRQAHQMTYLSPAQRTMWFLARLHPSSPTYNESRGYRLIGEVDVDALQQSVRYMAARHEILSYELLALRCRTATNHTHGPRHHVAMYRPWRDPQGRAERGD